MAGEKIYAALISCMRDIGAIEKSKTNTGQNYRFRGIDDVYAAAHPVFARHGVLCLPEVLDCQREERTTAKGSLLIYTTMRVKHRFIADDGSSVECITAGEGMDSGDKSSNKAMSAALKYAILETLMVPVSEPIDSEYESPAPAPKATPRCLDDEIAALASGPNGAALRGYMAHKGALKEGESLLKLTAAAKKSLLNRVDSVIHDANEWELAKKEAAK